MDKDFAFSKRNFIWIAISVALITIGFILMSGGSPVDGVSFNPEIFNKQRIVIAPAVTMAGFLLMVYSILIGDKKKPESKEDNTAE